MGTKNNPGEFDCYDNAGEDEPIFVLRAKDPLGPEVVRHWADSFSLQKSIENSDGQGPKSLTGRQASKLQEALNVANQMERWRKQNIRD